MTKLPLVLALFISILLTTSAIAQVPTDQARHFQVNATHTGSITSPGLTPPLRQKWSINFGDFISYPIIADGRVFVTVKHSGPLYDSQVYAIDAANGAIIWSFNLVACGRRSLMKTGGSLPRLTRAACGALMPRPEP